jgi:hypothetical protein
VLTVLFLALNLVVDVASCCICASAPLDWNAEKLLLCAFFGVDYHALAYLTLSIDSTSTATRIDPVAWYSLLKRVHEVHVERFALAFNAAGWIDRSVRQQPSIKTKWPNSVKLDTGWKWLRSKRMDETREIKLASNAFFAIWG